MTIMDLSSRYDAFQKDAVRAIVKDFNNNLIGRFLLVIPTGGGKTYAAVKSVCALFDQKILDIETETILWTAHRVELEEQAQETFEDFLSKNESSVNLEKNIKIAMISRVPSLLNSEKSIRLVIIDEAHHSAASSYRPIFSCRRVGVLGLTATPSRHDGQSLDFEKESYSIGFPDLLKKGIILRPEIETIQGGEYEFVDLGSNDDLELLNNEARNQKIQHAIKSSFEKYKKIIIYVGTKKHAEDLWKRLKNYEIAAEYESISYVLGGGDNSRSQ